jgi:hypothetical protein
MLHQERVQKGCESCGVFDAGKMSSALNNTKFSVLNEGSGCSDKVWRGAVRLMTASIRLMGAIEIYALNS